SFSAPKLAESIVVARQLRPLERSQRPMKTKEKRRRGCPLSLLPSDKGIGSSSLRLHLLLSKRDPIPGNGRSTSHSLTGAHGDHRSYRAHSVHVSSVRTEAHQIVHPRRSRISASIV